ncbi:hypothetical protein F5148DRAFT_1151467 [Russula earlei]|uniref:Uncharacterized protein n=1 Tax=Russula earlei TaxID=71964 RepID=A0ACC0U060_9AGAM|nr:hypothetical protein F5148DRAFT_1151467 [Russula earlei]
MKGKEWQQLEEGDEDKGEEECMWMQLLLHQLLRPAKKRGMNIQSFPLRVWANVHHQMLPTDEDDSASLQLSKEDEGSLSNQVAIVSSNVNTSAIDCNKVNKLEAHDTYEDDSADEDADIVLITGHTHLSLSKSSPHSIPPSKGLLSDHDIQADNVESDKDDEDDEFMQGATTRSKPAKKVKVTKKPQVTKAPNLQSKTQKAASTGQSNLPITHFLRHEFCDALGRLVMDCLSGIQNPVMATATTEIAIFELRMGAKTLMEGLER